MRYFIFVFFISVFVLSAGIAQAAEYSLDIDPQTVNVTGRPVKRITVKGAIPAPDLRFMEGAAAVNDDFVAAFGLRLMF